MATSNKDWQAYERAIARYYESVPNCEVVLDAKVPADSGRLRQVDVLLRLTAPPDFVITVGIEAKHYNKKIDSDTYDAIRAKFVSIGVDRGVIYCPHGLEAGPQQDLERSTNPQIELRQMTLEQVLEKGWGDDFLIAVDRLASAKTSGSPDNALQDQVVDSIERLPLHARYFFYKLDNPVWLAILSERGVLERAVQKQNAIPPLLAAEYVCKFVEAQPNVFLRFSEAVQESFSWLETDLVRAAMRLPAEFRSQFTETASAWNFDHAVDTEGIVELVRDQVAAGNTEGAMRLLSRVTRIWGTKSDLGELGSVVRLQSPVRDYWFTELTRKLLPTLVAEDPEGVVAYTRNRLTEALSIERPFEPDVLPTYAVANISKEGQFGPLDLLDTLVYTYKDVLQALCAKDSNKLLALVENDLESKSNGALVRAGLCATGDCPSVRGRIVEVVLKHDYVWRNYNFVPELEHLVSQAWVDLPSEVQAAVIRRVLTLERFDYRSDNIGDDDAEKYRKHHIIDWLLLLRGLGFPQEWLEEATHTLDQLSTETGKTKRFEHEGPRVVGIDPTPDDARKFPDMSAEEIVEYCAAFEAKFGFLEQETPHGVASMLQKEVARRPSEFLGLLDSIVTLPYPAYHSAIADGFTDSLRGESSLDRRAATEVLRQVILGANYRSVGDERRDLFDFGYPQWVRSAVARFLEQAAQSDPDPLLSQESLYELWKLLWPEADRSPTIQGNVDWFTEVINSEAGHLSMAICRLALRMNTLHGKAEAEQTSRQAALKWEQRLLDEIDHAILSANEPVVRAPMGFFFTGFFIGAKDWASERTDRIFDRSDPILWEAAWSCHFWITQRFVSVFEHLRPHYQFGLEVIDSKEIERRNWAERMGDDFAIFWMSGVLTREDDLLSLFWEKAPPRVKNSGTLWINAHLTSDNWDSEWPRARDWWQLAYEHRSEPDEDESQALFLHWLESAPSSLTVQEIEPLIISAVGNERHFLGDTVFGFLQERSHQEPAACARVVEAISRNVGLHIGISQDEDMKSLMEQLFATGDAEAKQAVTNAKRHLLSAGLFGYQHVLGNVGGEAEA
jgi:hypothetical protein